MHENDGHRLLPRSHRTQPPRPRRDQPSDRRSRHGAVTGVQSLCGQAKLHDWPRPVDPLGRWQHRGASEGGTLGLRILTWPGAAIRPSIGFRDDPRRTRSGCIGLGAVDHRRRLRFSDHASPARTDRGQGAPIRGAGYDPQQVARYSTFSVGPGVFYDIYLYKGLFVQPNMRFWPTVASTYDGAARFTRPDGSTYQHDRHDLGFFVNVNLGWTFSGV